MIVTGYVPVQEDSVDSGGAEAARFRGDADVAREWLAEAGVTRAEDGYWLDEGERLSDNDVAHTWAQAVMADEDLDEAGRLRVGFGLLDLLGEYWVTCEIGFAMARVDDPRVRDALWRAYRTRLEAPEPAEAIRYSLWGDWFEDRATVEEAFAQTLGNDAGRLRDGDAALLRRAGRVLEDSGPVPWALKEPVYEAATEVPELRAAVFRGLLLSYHDVFGHLEPEPALRLLARLPHDVEHFDRLSAVLRAGYRKHHLSPEAWDRYGPDGRT